MAISLPVWQRSTIKSTSSESQKTTQRWLWGWFHTIPMRPSARDLPATSNWSRTKRGKAPGRLQFPTGWTLILTTHPGSMPLSLRAVWPMIPFGGIQCQCATTAIRQLNGLCRAIRRWALRQWLCTTEHQNPVRFSITYCLKLVVLNYIILYVSCMHQMQRNYFYSAWS